MTADEPIKEDEIPSGEGELNPVPETEGIENAEVQEIEEEFNYNAEVAKVEAHYQERMKKWKEAQEKTFINDHTYRQWVNYDKDNKGRKVEKDSSAERLIPMAQLLHQKQLEIVEEKNAGILALDKKRDKIRMEKMEQI